MDEHDPRSFCFLGILVSCFLSVHDDRPLVSRINTGQDLHQSGFSGSVLTHERMNFSMPQDKTGIF